MVMFGPSGSLIAPSGGGGAAALQTPLARRPTVKGVNITPEIVLPLTGPLAPPLSVVSAAVANTFGAWTGYGTPAADLFINQLHVIEQALRPAATTYSLELSWGAGNTPLECQRGTNPLIDPTADDSGALLAPPGTCAFTKAPAGQLVSARYAHSNATQTAEVIIAGFSGAIPTGQFVQLAAFPTGAGRYLPGDLNNAGVNPANVGWPNFGAWLQLLAAAPNNMLVTHAIFQNPGIAAVTVPYAAIQLGIGPAGAEVACSTSVASRAWVAPDIWPPLLVLAGERLACRISCATGPTLAFKVTDL